MKTSYSVFTSNELVGSSRTINWGLIAKARAIHVRHLELREEALKSALDQVRFEQQKLADQRQRYDKQKEDFEARVSTTLLLPVIHGLALKFLMEQSKRQIDNLTDEQKEKLKDIFGADPKPNS